MVKPSLIWAAISINKQMKWGGWKKTKQCSIRVCIPVFLLVFVISAVCNSQSVLRWLTNEIYYLKIGIFLGRLKVEQKSHSSSSSSSSLQVVPESSYKFTSTKSPICSFLQLHFDLNYSFNNNNPTNLQESSNSEAPQAFLSLSPQFPQTQQNTPRLSIINKLRRLMMPKSLCGCWV